MDHSGTNSTPNGQVSEQLVKKQEQLDSTICENYALQARLRSAEERAQTFEKQLMEARASTGGLYDMETAGKTLWKDSIFDHYAMMFHLLSSLCRL